jgi:endoglucanase
MTRWRKRLVAAAITLALAGMSALFAGSGPGAQAAVNGCSVTYRILAQWPQGFQSQVTITNQGPTVTGWQLEFDFPTASQQVVDGWSANWDQQGNHVTATPESWNSELATNQPVIIGFLGASSGANPVPTGFKLNGLGCGGAGITEY